MPFEHFAVHQAMAEGYYDQADLDVSIIFGRGGADTLQALVTGSQDIAVGVGILSVIGANAKGCPGRDPRQHETRRWRALLVRAGEQSDQGLQGPQWQGAGLSSPGSTTSLTVNTLIKEMGIKPKLVAVGPMAAARTQVMSGQVATGWATFPSAVDLVRKGEVRIVGYGSEAKAMEGTTMRVCGGQQRLGRRRTGRPR